jgi:hypothetical protein
VVINYCLTITPVALSADVVTTETVIVLENQFDFKNE